ncbi:mPR-like GPCR protein [Terfezia boudieri ATCC MYA-4762]|uniref:MPR-like GPCR protein n=1 Tax=Terfezia boudieri ATCC MYA-4762 TaxID=1051890 RepID=A0A3N4L8U9_9PEZI|nr:mPR-like GPCR protein [Terfezia boudieri ATCC MYA-4762]
MPNPPQTKPDTSKHSSETRTLLSYKEIPPWHQDNDYILHGYRPISNSSLECLTSWSYLHNETVNIFSHLIPALLALAIALALETVNRKFFLFYYPEATRGDIIAFTFYLLSASLCLGISTAYHTLMNHSELVSNLWLRMDFLGIIILIEGCFVSGIYVTFYCEPSLQRLYWGMIVTLGILTALVVVNPKCQGRRWRTFRLSLFVATGLSAVAPICHGLKLFGWDQMNKYSGLPYYLLEGLLLVVGAYFYNTRIPETFKPGAFDIWGSSHQIFHLLVVSAAAVHLYGIWSAFDYNYTQRRCAPGLVGL